ncbi:MAG: hypothetical protein M1816_007908 [Peltula sp. TS41687]|nr:MAG: hypothetical protein M1816_007908 [Peltula sp. TS41687]
MADLQQHELKLVNKELSLDFFNSTKTPVMRPPVDPDEGAVCFKNPTYAAGAAIWQYYANNYCRNRFPGDTSQILASGNPDEPVGTVDLSDRPNWFKLNFQIKVHPGIAVTEWVNQEKCMAGFTRVIDYAVRRWECDGYTGRQYGDGMGSWAGGNNEGASSGNSIAYYMWTSK